MLAMNNARAARGRFAAPESRFWRLLIRGCAALAVTLGIYRLLARDLTSRGSS